MANKKPVQTKRSFDVVFVQCELDKETKERVKLWDPKFAATLDGITDLVSAGYKVSISHDKYNDCVGCFVTMPDSQHQNNGFCLTGRGPDVLAAMKVVVFKHFQILDSVWSTEVNQEFKRDAWG